MKITILKNKYVVLTIVSLVVFIVITWHITFLLQRDIEFIKNLYHPSSITAILLIIISGILKGQKIIKNHFANIAIDIIAWLLTISAVTSVLVTYNVETKNTYEQSINYIIQQVKVIVNNPDLFSGK